MCCKTFWATFIRRVRKSRFCSVKGGPGDTRTTVSATQKNGHCKSFQINPDDDDILVMDKTCAYRILKVQVRISARELLGPTFTITRAYEVR